MSVLRILVADDHVLIRHGIKNLLKQDERLLVVGEVGDGEELLRLLQTTAVDLVILDISMPNLGGMEVIGQVKSGYPQIKILMLTMHKNEQYFCNAMAAGADGYLLKDDSEEELLLAIDRILHDKHYISPTIAEEFGGDAFALYRALHKNPFAELTKREREILQLVIQGFTSKMMAKQLNLSQRTVDHHRASLLRKLKRKNSADLVNYAVRHGYIVPE